MPLCPCLLCCSLKNDFSASKNPGGETMKKLFLVLGQLVFVSGIFLCLTQCAPALQGGVVSTPDIGATATAEVYANWTETYQTAIAQALSATPTPTLPE